jgi:hypothetical protein
MEGGGFAKDFAIVLGAMLVVGMLYYLIYSRLTRCDCKPNNGKHWPTCKTHRFDRTEKWRD